MLENSAFVGGCLLKTSLKYDETAWKVGLGFSEFKNGKKAWFFGKNEKS